MKASRPMIRLALYESLERLLPPTIRASLLRSRMMRSLRKELFGSPNEPAIASGVVQWEDWRFHFAAHYRGFLKAEKTGIENRICRLARSILKPGDVAIDVGANYGFITTVLAKSVQPGGVVVAFEPEAGICKMFRQTLAENELDGLLHLIEARAGSRQGDGSVTVDAIVQERQIDSMAFLKIDVDGDDLGVLEGARTSLRTHHPVVVVEMLKAKEQIYDLLCETGYTHFFDQSNRTVSPGRWPLNLIAATSTVRIPERGSFKPP